eukprot:TRINITY_DN10498_c0_g1_i8.p1 TRINITY_DN10498_c0_g1~~TRINITY_DN10498_c0_g1_i8.p1  ORF type:complete len:142 (-),score=0.72 TRINITY_DN10498_c0_g1_i8:60-440(-)
MCIRDSLHTEQAEHFLLSLFLPLLPKLCVAHYLRRVLLLQPSVSELYSPQSLVRLLFKLISNIILHYQFGNFDDFIFGGEGVGIEPLFELGDFGIEVALELRAVLTGRLKLVLRLISGLPCLQQPI